MADVLPLDHVRDAIIRLQELDSVTCAHVVDVRVDRVRWAPFCGRWDCPCARPDSDPCPQWEGYGNMERCPRCGWPEHRHPIRFHVARRPATPSDDDDPCPWRVMCSSSRCDTPWWLPDQVAALRSASRHYGSEHAAVR